MVTQGKVERLEQARQLGQDSLEMYQVRTRRQADDLLGYRIGNNVLHEGFGNLYAAIPLEGGTTAFWTASEVISAAEEARLNGLACHRAIKPKRAA